MDVKDIVSSWGRVFNNTEQEKLLAEKRYLICLDCENKMGIFCGLCGCVLKAKIFTKNYGSCPAGKWTNIDNEQVGKKVKTTL